MKKTPWSTSSSLPSDRIPARSSPNPSGSSKSKSSKSNQQNARPKSARVRELETIITALAQSELADPDPKGGCFCQARVHTLSPYIPICHSSCGLVLCSANSPAFSCPHCMTPLMTILEKSDLVAKLSVEVIETEEKEEAERRRVEEERRERAGAFPTLGDTTTGSGGGVLAPVPTTHKVLSLTGSAKGKKKVTMSSYTTPPAGSRVGTPDNAGSTSASTTKKPKEPERVPPPPGPPTPAYPADKSRPFRNLLAPAEWYVHPPQVTRVVEDGNPKSKRGGKRKGGEKGKEREGGGGKENASGNAGG